MTFSPEKEPNPAVCWHWPLVPNEEMTVVSVWRKTGLNPLSTDESNNDTLKLQIQFITELKVE
jgi:hypothetical protein